MEDQEIDNFFEDMDNRKSKNDKRRKRNRYRHSSKCHIRKENQEY